MRITKSQLKQIIKEEIERAFKTDVSDDDVLKHGRDLDEELMDEKCKGSGCATPKEVEKYAKAIKRDADNKNEVNPYAVAWKAAREPGSEGGTTVVGRKKGYKK